MDLLHPRCAGLDVQRETVVACERVANDAMWLADLLAHSLIRASFVPPAPVDQQRMLTRTRRLLVREGAQHSNRIHKVLEDCDLKLTSVGTNVMGMTGRAILEALGAGQTDSVQLSELVCGSLKRRKQALAQAATHRQYLLKLHLGLHDAQAIASLGGQL